jgi:hypothetical protein
MNPGDTNSIAHTMLRDGASDGGDLSDDLMAGNHGIA